MSKEINDTQVSQIRNAISKVVAAGPAFLAKKIPATEMAHTMVNAVKEYANQAEKNGSVQPESEEASELLDVLGELMGCGSGFLQQRCDADCVARTITYMVNEFPNKAPVA